MNQTTYSFPQLVNRSSRKIELSTGNKSINECLGILLRTRPGELLGDPNYGCNLIDRIFMYNGVVVQTLIIEDILSAISKYEPRIIVTDNDIVLEQDKQVIRIYIQYVVKETGQVNEFNMEVTPDDSPYKQ